MQNNKLNCPFCDCGAIYEITETEDIVEKVPALFCNGCKMIFKVENDSPYLNDDMTFEYLKEKLHKQFNTRKPMELIVEQLEEYEEEAKQLGVGGMLSDIIEVVKGGVDNAGRFD